MLLLLHLFLLSFGYSLPSRLEAGEGSDTHTHTHTHVHTLWRSYDKARQRKLDPAAFFIVAIVAFPRLLSSAWRRHRGFVQRTQIWTFCGLPAVSEDDWVWTLLSQRACVSVEG